MRRNNHIGRRYSRLKVISRTRRGLNQSSSYYVRAECTCGTIKRYKLCHLVSGHTQSCGKCEWARTQHSLAGSQARTKHGHTRGNRRSAEYICWVNLRQRVFNANLPDFKYWGGRGITVCKRWTGANGFANFLADMKVRGNGLSIHRKNSNRGYTPSNCVWADATTQATERSVSKKAA
jgi:hypothetical protein